MHIINIAIFSLGNFLYGAQGHIDKLNLSSKAIAMSQKTITRTDLSEAVYQKLGLSRIESAELVETVLDIISDRIVEGESVKLSSFGSFLVRSKNERIGRNPKTGEEVPITPRRVMVFKPSNILKEAVLKGHKK